MNTQNTLRSVRWNEENVNRSTIVRQESTKFSKIIMLVMYKKWNECTRNSML